MAQSLVIVESPAKAKTIGKFLGKNFKVHASMGHVRDLPKSQIGVDIDNNYEPKYITIRGKGEILSTLKKEAKKSDKIYLATDPDREGEAISWHLAHALGLNNDDSIRIEFNEITKTAVKSAIKNPRRINNNLVYAQQARRIVDRLVGYQISPILWRKIKWGLSAGRVQSVAVKLICDREKEIREFIPKEYWSLTAKLKAKGGVFEAKFHGKGKTKLPLDNENDVNKILDEIKSKDFVVHEVKKSERKRVPPAPFITSTLQQEAYKKINFSTKKTMSVAQQLYEGIDIKGEGTVGLITYMRTDSTRLSTEAQDSAKSFIEEEYGKEYLSPINRVYKSKGTSQDAHEAVRPTSALRTPEKIKDSLTNDQFKLYKLIWSRFIASQMSDAIFNSVSVDVTVGEYLFKASGSTIKFPGFLNTYKIDDDDESKKLPELNEGEVLISKGIEPKQHFTQPPARYTEASLVKTLEENGIGRPSTYAPIISTITDRGYVLKDKKTLAPTELGEIVTELLIEYFNNIVNVEFTANMEKKLDEIEAGSEEWREVVNNFYSPLKDLIETAEEQIAKISIEEPVEVTDILCDKCGKNMVIKHGRYGKFLACPDYPECKNTKPILEEIDVPCPKCESTIVIRRSKKGRTFYGCSSYPECDFVSWNKPTNKKCPVCGEILYEKATKKETKLICNNGDYEEKIENNPDDEKIN
ncbi:type I DNA topoisomerase [Clostridium cylindrosporum]|uniref:DNA topoisomerase 1 n=1 Tax=Clostridium cylindrosporum DSM 605 TaxID=1121307 RepID=A0A0J8G634_CLOCY|nr:type I DNA topoisomerase [Clostridium cylindrosporum]KMT23086.1 DNA topoisomerase 1 [Clostridium cylindrosporum DSM 605]